MLKIYWIQINLVVVFILSRYWFKSFIQINTLSTSCVLLCDAVMLCFVWCSVGFIVLWSDPPHFERGPAPTLFECGVLCCASWDLLLCEMMGHPSLCYGKIFISRAYANRPLHLYLSRWCASLWKDIYSYAVHRVCDVAGYFVWNDGPLHLIISEVYSIDVQLILMQELVKLCYAVMCCVPWDLLLDPFIEGYSFREKLV